ncbi:MAG TPA: N-acetylmuramoyl-L-alanine amidase [Candidatus Gastranaerophilaceae bacterium]|nr:N-acetylmuramoyl-L-alanine amidase [Candidatus Gastranaerophilaceae bacterium]HPT41328.1 N-acetylmuramoyl-L-alanine amidase [Candidatus Gastranaerophilaceae bacterium]
MGHFRLPLEGKTIMINSGHGAQKGPSLVDEGAKAKSGKKIIKEADLNDKVAINVKRKLTKLGAEVIYLDNMPLPMIRKIQEGVKADLFVSIHHDSKPAGFKHNSGETIFAFGEKSTPLAQTINKWFKQDDTIPNNGINSAWAQQLYVLQSSNIIPSVLVEVGHMSNKNELKILNKQEYQDIEAQNIVEGIRDFFRLPVKKKPQYKSSINNENFRKYKTYKTTPPNPFFGHKDLIK